MLAQLADLRLCALMSLRSYVPAPLRPCALMSAPLCRVSGKGAQASLIKI